MKRLLIAIAAAATTMFASARVLTQAGFEEESLDGGFTGGGTPKPYGEDEQTESEAYPFDSFGDYYCDIDADTNEPLTSPSTSGAVFDMFVQFTPMTETPTVDDDAKIAVYLNSDGKLVVAGDSDYECTTPAAAGEWARLTIVPVTGGYKVYVGGYPLSATGITDGVFPAKNSGVASYVAFTGTGKLDNFVARTTDPFDPPSTYVASVGGENGERYATFADALADAAADSVIELNGNVDGTFALPTAGAKIKLNGYTFSGFARVTGNSLLVAVASSADADGVTTYSSAYFPRTATAGQDGTAEHPYEIADVDDLQALATAVASVPAARTNSYVQTANIDMTGADAFAGIGGYNADPTKGTPFTGTYDGGSYKISNVDFTQRNYGGVFNQVNGGTIKNLTVSNITCNAYSATENDGEFGFAIVGNAGNGAVITNIVAEGVFASAEQPATHNIAGIVVRACGGGENGTLIKDCTNNATLYGAYTKIGGICALTQYKIAGGAVTFDGCVNNGDIISSRTTATGVTGYAGILGYNDDNTVIVNCSNTGSIVNESGANTDKDGAIVGWAYTKDAKSVRSLTDQGGNSAAKTDKMLAFVSDLADVTGFKYATVANDVATTVTSLSAGNTYLLEGNVAASETPVFNFTEAGTISFDAALGYAFAGTVTADASLIFSGEPAVVENVSTYTAYSVVAKIGDERYATLAEALAKADAKDDTVIDLVSDISETVNVPSNVTVRVADGVAVNDGSKLSGSGRFVYTRIPERFRFQYEQWTGTVVLDYDITGDLMIHAYGTTGSTVEYAKTAKGYYIAQTTVYPTIKVTGSLEFSDGTTQTRVTLNKITGDGALTFSSAKNYTVAALEDWNGTLTNNFASVEITSINSGKGTVYSAVKPTTVPTFGNDWSGTYEIGWAGANNEAIAFNSYATQNSVVKIPEGKTLQGYIQVTANNTLTIEAKELVLDGTLNLSNGYDYSTVVWKKVSGAGTLKFAFTPTNWIKEQITSLDGFTGSIEVSATTQLEIGSVNVATAPVAGAVVVPMTVTEGGTVGGDLKLYVAGEDSGETLVYDATKGGLVLYVAPTPKAAEVVGGEQYETLAEALAAAADGATVKLLSDATLAAMVTLSKNLVLDLNGYTLGNEGDTKSLFSIINGATLTVNGSVSTYCYGRFNVGAKNTSGNLVLNNGYYMVGDEQTVIHVNGLCTASTVTVTGATIYSPTDNGVQFSGTGTYVLNNATVVGATAVYMKAGSLALNGTTSLNATGDKKAVTTNNNGSDATGDALVLDSCTPPYAAITGVTVAATVRFTSANGSAVLAYARTGNTRVTKVLPKNVTISEAVATESDLFVGGSIDPTAATKTTEVEAVDAEAAIEAVTVDVPRSIGTNTGVTAEQYKSYFKYVATPVEGKEGVYEVELVGLADDVQADADADAMDVLNGKAVAITMKPGLYYGVSAVTSLTDAGIATPQYSMLGGANGATTLDVEKPGTTRGFIKVWISTQTIQ